MEQAKAILRQLKTVLETEGEGPEADRLRDSLDAPIFAMNEEEQRAFGLWTWEYEAEREAHWQSVGGYFGVTVDDAKRMANPKFIASYEVPVSPNFKPSKMVVCS